MAETKFSALKTRIKTAIILLLILALVVLSGQTAIYFFLCLVALLAQ